MLKNAYGKRLLFFVIVLTFLLLTPSVFAHSGRTDSAGGHFDKSEGEYHYHHGYPAHQHTNGICPYEVEEQGEYEDTNDAFSENDNDHNKENSVPENNKTEKPLTSDEKYVSSALSRENEHLRSTQQVIDAYNRLCGITEQKASLEEIQEMVSDWISETDYMLSGFATAKKNSSIEEFQKYNKIKPLQDSAREIKREAISSEKEIGKDVVNSILFMIDLRIETMNAYSLDASNYHALKTKIESMEKENSLSKERLMWIYILSCTVVLLFALIIVLLVKQKRKPNFSRKNV